ncbi:MAG TPA: hypothetical protein PK141_04490 [Polyangiaceae bacterium]|nr:hypothetical protein [Polyangiaceae bacterium]
MPRRVSASLVLVALVASLTHAGRASAGDKELCLQASEDGQRARVAGRLLEARVQFVTCARPVCPPIVRNACTSWLDEVERAMPTISVGVQDARGRDLLDARVLVDGRPPPDHDAGRSFPLDPGSHLVRAEVKGKLYEEHVIVKEGEKARAITVRVPLGAEPTPEVSPSALAAPSASSPPGRSIGPFLVLGAGVVATGVGLGVFFAGAGAFPDNCRTDTATSERGGTCAKTPEDPTGAASTDAAVSAVNQRNVGLGIVAGGGALLVGGLVWWLLDSPAQPKAAAMRVSPALGPGFSGLAWTGAF